MSVLTDRYGRTLNYLRLSVTDRCNFRCYYCMPEEGMQFVDRADLLRLDEMLRLSRIFCGAGVQKIRITGGEPFLRKDLPQFLTELAAIPGLNEISITTNGSLHERHLELLQKLGIRSINVSLDSLDPERFYHITRRDRFTAVYAGIEKMLQLGFEVKLNAVIAAGVNTGDILPFVELTREKPLSVRFLEEMPFNGGDHDYRQTWSYQDIMTHILAAYPVMESLNDAPESTSVNYRIPDYIGSFGVIPAFSRTFCGTCNRIRLAATGELRTCLYGAPTSNLRDILRNGANDAQVLAEIAGSVAMREPDGYAAESANRAGHHSMSVLGG
jgi:molybdenum cofactor biosynthesis protein A